MRLFIKALSLYRRRLNLKRTSTFVIVATLISLGAVGCVGANLIKQREFFLLIGMFSALFFGGGTFALLYAVSVVLIGHQERSKSIQTLKKTKESISLKQRLSLASVCLVVMIVLSSLTRETVIYTFSVALVVFMIPFLLLFINPSKEELNMVYYKVEDIRDIQRKNENKEKRRKETKK